MFVRLWKTRVDPSREEEYVRFTEYHTLPMLQHQPGCLGALFLNWPPKWGILSYWQDEDAMSTHASSPAYLQTMRRLEETELLIGKSSVEVFAVHGGFMGSTIMETGRREMEDESWRVRRQS